MSRWWPEILTVRDAVIALRIGFCAALGFAAWLGVPMAIEFIFGGHESEVTNPVELLITVILVQFALYAAWRFGNLTGWVVGPILVVVLIVEMTKRAILTIYRIPSLTVFDAFVAVGIFLGLIHGIRGARALRHVLPEDHMKRDRADDEDLKDVFK